MINAQIKKKKNRKEKKRRSEEENRSNRTKHEKSESPSSCCYSQSFELKWPIVERNAYFRNYKEHFT